MIEIVANSYGKSRVRLVKVTRADGVHDLAEWTVEVLLEGDFEAVHRVGDNSKLVATDTMKNTVYSVARWSSAKSIEGFAGELAEFMLGRNAQVSAVKVKVESAMWKRLTVDGRPHPDSFMRGSAERQVTRLRLERGGRRQVVSGFEEMVVMKTARSGFSGFMRDELTTLPETADRLLGTAVSAHWTFTDGAVRGETDFDGVRTELREAMLKTFAGHDSLSVQHTLYAMGETALETSEAIEEIHLVMPNRHCLLVDLSRFGQDNPNEIFVPTDEPHGTIDARLRRG